MANKHYDINYLQNSRRLLLNLKEHSYTFFEKINSGTIIDLGCGAGNDVIELAKITGKDVKVIGIDHDPVMLKQAKEQSKEVSNVDFILSEAYPLPFEDETISGIRTERVIQHLNNPEQVISEISRILKKDCPLVIIETDWSSLSFYTEFVEAQKKVNAYYTDVKINNGFAAAKLVSYLQQNNFRNIKFEIHPFITDSLKTANELFRIEQMINEAAEKSYIAEQEGRAFYGALQKADDGNYFACAINLVVATCIK
ncbi:methyltransferase domain-containing protein [Mucilaginibacter sp.]|uniref:methyltransferase domain-containing protein n=1 Tax=Mucilaginibacter sp. TaxID=1882438 RepID=UPI0025CDFB7E|nr:methyltransferase domain-containing protein [Mucilaginibacter sp.]